MINNKKEGILKKTVLTAIFLFITATCSHATIFQYQISSLDNGAFIWNNSSLSKTPISIFGSAFISDIDIHPETFGIWVFTIPSMTIELGDYFLSVVDGDVGFESFGIPGSVYEGVREVGLDSGLGNSNLGIEFMPMDGFDEWLLPWNEFSLPKQMTWSPQNPTINLSPDKELVVGSLSFNRVAPVPEPGTFLLLGVGLASFAFYRRKVRK